MKIERIWAMPNKWTFKIKPIKELLDRYVIDGRFWIDPFAGENSPAWITNDLNPKRDTKHHMPADEFLKYLILEQKEYEGILFDPPYSARQVKECYESIGRKMSYSDTLNGMFHIEKTIASKLIKIGGYVITFGWNSNGFGMKRGYEIIEILLVPHGGHHNDTICTVERRIK